uniref:Uncharacterized protein n=1 Tax=Helicotheca tamesis TaxID=374047 RepID=A0A7S2HJG0_9STRA
MSYSCNDNQNYFVADGKTTSRVISEPGGKSSICLGWDDGSSNIETKKKAATEELNRTEKEAEKQEEEEKKETEEESESAAAATDKSSSSWGTMNFGDDSEEKPISNNAFASGSNMNSGNVITGRPSSRVLNPPGGKTSITLG